MKIYNLATLFHFRTFSLLQLLEWLCKILGRFVGWHSASVRSTDVERRPLHQQRRGMNACRDVYRTSTTVWPDWSNFFAIWTNFFAIGAIFLPRSFLNFTSTYVGFFVARNSRILHPTNERPDRFGLLLLCQEQNTVILITVSSTYVCGMH
jgi:hypothetical protein